MVEHVYLLASSQALKNNALTFIIYYFYHIVLWLFVWCGRAIIFVI